MNATDLDNLGLAIKPLAPGEESMTLEEARATAPEVTPEAFKTIPCGELKLVAYVIVETDMDGEVDENLEVIEPELMEQLKFRGNGKRCAACGHQLKYVCMVAHVPTKTGYYVGRDCAHKVAHMSNLPDFEALGLAMAERRACDKRESAWLAANPQHVAIIDWCRAQDNKFCHDLISKLRSFGKVSQGQLDALYASKVRSESLTGVAAPTGTSTITGVIVSAKHETVPGYGYKAPSTQVAKVLIELPNLSRVYGKITFHDGYRITKPEVQAATKGDIMALTASFEQKAGEPSFGFFKRARKIVVTPVAKPDAPKQATLEEKRALIVRNHELRARINQFNAERFDDIEAGAIACAEEQEMIDEIVKNRVIINS